MEDGGWWVGTGWGSREPTHVRPGVQTGVGPDAVRREHSGWVSGVHTRVDVGPDAPDFLSSWTRGMWRRGLQ